MVGENGVISHWGWSEGELGVKDLSTLINHLQHIQNSSVLTLCPLFLNQPCTVRQPHHMHIAVETILQSSNTLVFNLRFCVWKSKACLVMTSVWAMCGGPFEPLCPPPPHPSSPSTGFTHPHSRDGVQLCRARSTTTQMTYGASSGLTSSFRQSHFIKCKSKGTIS